MALLVQYYLSSLLKRWSIMLLSLATNALRFAAGRSGELKEDMQGVTHIDVDQLDEQRAGEINDYLNSKGVEISGLGYYPNPLDPDQEKRKFYADHIKKVIDASAMLGVNRINTFIGRDKNKSVD